MLCRCVRVAARRGGAAAAAAGGSAQQRLLVFRPHPIVSLSYSTAANNDVGRNAPTTTACSGSSNSSSVVERRYSRDIMFSRQPQQQQQQRCVSAVSSMIPEEPEEEQKPKRQSRKERPREVIEEGIRELRVQLRPSNEQGSAGSRRVRKGMLCIYCAEGLYCEPKAPALTPLPTSMPLCAAWCVL